MFEVKVLNAANKLYRKVAAVCELRIAKKSDKSVREYQNEVDFSETCKRIAKEATLKAEQVARNALKSYAARQEEITKAGIVAETALSHKL